MIADASLSRARDNSKIERILKYQTIEKPLTVQLASTSLEDIKKATKICNDFGFDAINLNCGCPSPTAIKSKFGAKLMKEPEVFIQTKISIQLEFSLILTKKKKKVCGFHSFYNETKQFYSS